MYITKKLQNAGFKLAIVPFSKCLKICNRAGYYSLSNILRMENLCRLKSRILKYLGYNKTFLRVLTPLHTKKLIQALTLLILLGFIWGSGYSLARYAMTHEVPPLGYAFWQSAGPALLLMLFCLGPSRRLLWSPRYWWYYGICACIGIVIPNTNMYFIAAKLPAGLLAVLVNTVPLMVYPMALLYKQEQKDGLRLLAILLGMSGIIAIVSPNPHTLLSNWSLLALISPFSFALCALFIAARQPAAMHPLPAACGMLISATVLICPLVWQQQAFYPLTFPFNRTQQVVLLEIILSTMGYLIFFRLIRLAGPVFYSLTGTVVALTGLFWGFALFHERLDQHEFIGILLIFTAILLLTWRQSKQSIVEIS